MFWRAPRWTVLEWRWNYSQNNTFSSWKRIPLVTERERAKNRDSLPARRSGAWMTCASKELPATGAALRQPSASASKVRVVSGRRCQRGVLSSTRRDRRESPETLRYAFRVDSHLRYVFSSSDWDELGSSNDEAQVTCHYKTASIVFNRHTRLTHFQNTQRRILLQSLLSTRGRLGRATRSPGSRAPRTPRPRIPASASSSYS